MHAPHTHTPETFHRAFAIGVVLNLCFVVVELFFGYRAESLSLIADALHNFGDVLGLLLAWAGIYLSQLTPNNRHTYGWKRASILAAFANATLLLMAMGSLAWEAFHRLRSPIEVDQNTVAIVALVGILINTATALLFLRGRHHDLNIRGAFLHMAADALVSLGVVIGAVIVRYTHWYWIDPCMSLLIAAVVVFGTWELFRESTHLLLDGVPKSVQLPEVLEYLNQIPEVDKVVDLHIWALSTSESALTAHLIVRVDQGRDELLEEISAQLHDRFGIEHSTIQLMRYPIPLHCNSMKK